MRPVQPIGDLAKRAPEQGRIRYGIYKDGRPQSINRFRFTSSDAEAIASIAERYGGAVRPFKVGKDVLGTEVIVEAETIPVLLPPDPLTGTPIYEMWSGGGLQRRCDGEVCTVNVQTADGWEPSEVPCICQVKKELGCKPITRLNVVLREIRFGGTWRLEAKGWNAAQELPGMVALIQDLQSQGLTPAALSLERRKRVAMGKTTWFMVPMLGLVESADALADRRLGPGHTLALEGGDTLEAPTTDDLLPAGGSTAGVLHDGGGVVLGGMPGHAVDDEVVDAEIVDEFQPRPKQQSPQQRKMYALMRELLIPAGERVGFAHQASKGRTRHTSELDEKEMGFVLDALEAIGAGTLVYEGLADDGITVRIRRAT